MPNDWHEAYDELKTYIAKTPVIEINLNSTYIPDDARLEFYRLFDTVRACFIHGKFPSAIKKARVLSRNWGEVSQAVKDSLKLETIHVPAETNWFLLDPVEGLLSGLRDPLFDLLKGKLDLTAFEQNAIQLVKDEFIKFFRTGYQLWATVSIFKLVSADAVYRVPAPDYESHMSMFEDGSMQRGWYHEGVSDAEETKKISFARDSMWHSFLVPNAILHSKSFDFYTAFCPGFYPATWKADNASPKQQWYRISDIVREFGESKLWPDLAIYTGNHWRELVLVSDYFQVAQPDIIVEFREDNNWYEKEGLELIKRHYHALKPKLGSFVVCLEPMPEAALTELEVRPINQIRALGALSETAPRPDLNISLLNVGYDLSRLIPITKAIIKAQTKPEETKCENV